MGKWFRRRADVEFPAVPKEWCKALESALSGLGQGHPDLPRQLRDYVLAGSPESALARVATCSDAPRELCVGGPWFAGGDRAGRRALFALMHRVPAEVALRWAKVVESAVATNRWMISLDAVAGGHWAEALVIQQANVHMVDDDPRRPAELPMSHPTLEAIVVAGGGQPCDLLMAAFRESTAYNHGRTRDAVTRMPGYSEAVARHAEALRPVVLNPAASARQTAARMLTSLDDEALLLFASEVADYACGTSKEIRKVALPLAKRCGPVIAEPLRRLALEAKPGQRLHAFELLWDNGSAETRAWALQHAGADRAPSIQALAESWRDQPVGQEQDTDVLSQDQPRPEITWRVPVIPALCEALGAVLADVNRAIEKANARSAESAARWQAQHGQPAPWAHQAPLLEPAHLRALTKDLESDQPPREPGGKPNLAWGLLSDPIERNADNHAFSPVILLTLLVHLGNAFEHRGALSPLAAAAFNRHHQVTGRPTLLELSTMLDEAGVDGGRAVWGRYAASWGDLLAADWPDQDVAPFVAAHLDVVLESLTSTERDYYTQESAPYRALATLPKLPRSVADTLFSIALHGHKNQRRAAQDALASTGANEARIIAALSDGKGEVRTEAAQWLGRLRHEPAIPALEAAVAKEKQDIAKGAMLDALQALGQPVEKYLDRDKLAQQAKVAVAKGLPKDLDWFPWASLPEVRWADSGEPVPAATLQWLIAQAVRAKSPEPNAILRKYFGMVEAREREHLGQFLLETWMAEDLRPIAAEEAEQEAQQRAGWTFQSHQSHPQYYKDDPQFGMSVDELAAAYLPAFLRTPAASATSTKGILAVVAACAGERAVAPTARYLQEWYGMRASQGKALIAMLAWIDHPSATQLMLSVGSRFRTKSFQEEASRQAAALAERRGWTLSELADRTIPTAGFDETGTMQLSYGERVFTAVLRSDLTIELRSPEGAKVLSLPSPRKSDDQDRAKQSKKVLAVARKELTAVGKLQTERLYEALCTERTWAFEDWHRYLAGHPIVGHLTERLVWSATGADGTAYVFRPLEDGTLTDADDAEVTVPADAVVQVAHDSNLGDEAVARWQQHLEDYEVTALFQQFGKGAYELPEGQGSRKRIDDFTGHLIEAFALRGRATRLGYTRGGSEDGGWFYTYAKNFPTLGMSSVVEFSGNPLPETNRTVALTGLRFERHADGGRRSAMPMRLEDVPGVLLSEAYNDLRLLAAEGTGYDPDWEKKVAF